MACFSLLPIYVEKDQGFASVEFQLAEEIFPV